MDYQYINKYLNGEASEAEVAEIFQWIEASPENKEEFIACKKIWALTARGDENEAHSWNIALAPVFQSKKPGRLYIQIARYAAVFLLAFGGGLFLRYNGGSVEKEKLVYQKTTTITAPPGQMTNMELPDGTRITLNSGSSIVYDADFSLGERVVSLNGEAYFDVAKDKEHPFVIETNLFKFRVYGTSFNVEAYSKENIVNTTLVEGSLGVINNNNKEFIRLTPGENLHFDKHTSNLSVNHVNAELYTSWKDGLITFRNEKLKDIARKVERWYNVEIVIVNPKLGEEAYFGTVMKNKPIDQILEVFKLTSSLKYKIVSRPDKSTLIYWDY
jgi:transmembrane sensor